MTDALIARVAALEEALASLSQHVADRAGLVVPSSASPQDLLEFLSLQSSIQAPDLFIPEPQARTADDAADTMNDSSLYAGRAGGVTGFDTPAGRIYATRPTPFQPVMLEDSYQGDGTWTGSEAGGVKSATFAYTSGYYVAAHLTWDGPDALNDDQDWKAPYDGDTAASGVQGYPVLGCYTYEHEWDARNHGQTTEDNGEVWYAKIVHREHEAGGAGIGKVFVTAAGGTWTLSDLPVNTDTKISAVQKDDVGVATDVSTLNFEDTGDATVSVTDNGGGKVTVSIDATSSGDTDDKDVKVSANDTTAAYLASKLTATGNWLTATETNDGGNETLNVTHNDQQASAWSDYVVTDIEYDPDVQSCLNYTYATLSVDDKGHVRDADWAEVSWQDVPVAT